MKSIKHYVCLTLLMTLSACQSLGIPSADTFNKKLLTGYALVETIGNTSNTLLQAEKLSKQDAANVLQQASVAKISLDVSRTVYQENPQIGSAKLAATLTVLQALQSYVGGVK